MSIDLTRKPFIYYPRRSLCECCKCTICSDRNERATCERFDPKHGIRFVQCEVCKCFFEVHNARKSDRITICPTCQMKKLKRKRKKKAGKNE